MRVAMLKSQLFQVPNEMIHDLKAVSLPPSEATSGDPVGVGRMSTWGPRSALRYAAFVRDDKFESCELDK